MFKKSSRFAAQNRRTARQAAFRKKRSVASQLSMKFRKPMFYRQIKVRIQDTTVTPNAPLIWPNGTNLSYTLDVAKLMSSQLALGEREAFERIFGFMAVTSIVAEIQPSEVTITGINPLKMTPVVMSWDIQNSSALTSFGSGLEKKHVVYNAKTGTDRKLFIKLPNFGPFNGSYQTTKLLNNSLTAGDFGWIKLYAENTQSPQNIEMGYVTLTFNCYFFHKS